MARGTSVRRDIGSDVTQLLLDAICAHTFVQRQNNHGTSFWINPDYGCTVQRAETKYTTFIRPRRNTTSDVVSRHVIHVLFSTACNGDTEPYVAIQ